MGIGYDLPQGGPAGRTEPLEARDLGLDRDALLCRGIEHQTAVRRDRAAGALGGRAVITGRGEVERAWPQPRRVGIEPEDELGTTPRDLPGQPVAERDHPVRPGPGGPAEIAACVIGKSTRRNDGLARDGHAPGELLRR